MRRLLSPFIVLALLAIAQPTAAQSDDLDDVTMRCLRFATTSTGDAEFAEMVDRLPYRTYPTNPTSSGGSRIIREHLFAVAASFVLSDQDRAVLVGAVGDGAVALEDVDADTCLADGDALDLDALIADGMIDLEAAFDATLDGTIDLGSFVSTEPDDPGVDPGPDPDEADPSRPTTESRSAEPDPTPRVTKTGPPPARSERDPAAADRTPYARFVARGVKAIIDLASLAEASRGAEGTAEVVRAARRLERWADGQQRWLRDHRPQRCYRDAHRRWRQHIGLVSDGARDLRVGINALDAARAARGVRRIADGARRIEAIDFDAASERCLAAARR